MKNNILVKYINYKYRVYIYNYFNKWKFIDYYTKLNKLSAIKWGIPTLFFICCMPFKRFIPIYNIKLHPKILNKLIPLFLYCYGYYYSYKRAQPYIKHCTIKDKKY